MSVVLAFVALGEAAAAKTNNLWSTINICDTHKHPNKLGVRGRMPNDGHKSHTLWMKFIAQYKNTNTHKWQKVTSTKFEKLGDGSTSWRSSGKTFTITFAKAAPKGTHFTFRGLVKYQWRSGSTVVLSKQRTTTSGHPAMNSDPPGYSAATCVITK